MSRLAYKDPTPRGLANRSFSVPHKISNEADWNGAVEHSDFSNRHTIESWRRPRFFGSCSTSAIRWGDTNIYGTTGSAGIASRPPVVYIVLSTPFDRRTAETGGFKTNCEWPCI